MDRSALWKQTSWGQRTLRRMAGASCRPRPVAAVTPVAVMETVALPFEDEQSASLRRAFEQWQQAIKATRFIAPESYSIESLFGGRFVIHTRPVEYITLTIVLTPFGVEVSDHQGDVMVDMLFEAGDEDPAGSSALVDIEVADG